VGTTLLLTFDFPPHGGGIARMMGELALKYPKGSLVVSTGRYPESASTDAAFPQVVDRASVPAERLRTAHGLVRWTARLETLYRRHAPGFAWCGTLKPAGYPARWLLARHGMPYGVVVHGTDLLLLREKIRGSPLRRWAAAKLLADAAAIVSNSSWTASLAKEVLTLLGRPDAIPRVQPVPLGTEPSRFRPGLDTRAVRARFGLEGGPWLLTVARLEWHKGIDTVIRTLPAIRAAHPAARYAVAGVGPRRAALLALISELGLDGAVRLLGPASDADLPALYNAADLYLGPSRLAEQMVEGFGISLVEASACGIAVVAGRSGGVPDAVRDGETGILVDPDDPAAVAKGVNDLLGDPERRKRMGAAGRRAVETYYNWERVARDFIRIDEATRRPPAGR